MSETQKSWGDLQRGENERTEEEGRQSKLLLCPMGNQGSQDPEGLTVLRKLDKITDSKHCISFQFEHTSSSQFTPETSFKQ